MPNDRAASLRQQLMENADVDYFNHQSCVRVGNACVWALGNQPGMEGVGQLALLKLKVKFGAAQKGIEKAIGGANGRHLDYWRNHSFGELTATAATRKQVLERLVPRLKIADRCRFGERFLIVRGKLRTYKIHLGGRQNNHASQSRPSRPKPERR